MGADGIPGEVYKILWTHRPCRARNDESHQWRTSDSRRVEDREITHIRKRNSPLECANYRLICLTQLFYKIWPELQTNRIARIIRLLESNSQFGNKNGLSAIDSIIKLEHAIHAGPPTKHRNFLDGPIDGVWLFESQNSTSRALQSRTTNTHNKKYTTWGAKTRNYNVRAPGRTESQ